MTPALGVALAWLAVSLVVGALPGRSGMSTEGFVAGDRGLGLLVMYFITGATVFSAFAFLGGPGWACSRGVAALYILGYGAIGLTPLWFLGARAARVGRSRGFVTQAEMIASRYDRPAIALVMAAVSVAAFVPYLALQMKGAGAVLEVVSEGAVPEAWGAALTYAVVTVYVLRSGVLGVGWTNVLQGLFMLALAWGLGLYLPWRLYGGVVPMFDRIAAERPELLVPPGLAADGSPWTWRAWSTSVLVSTAGFCAWPHLFMKAFTAASVKTLRRTVVLYPSFQLFLVPLFLIGFAGALYEPQPATPDQILPHLLVSLALPGVVVGLFCAGALAASMSSGDAMAHAAAAIAVRDGLRRGLGWTPSDAAELRAIRVGIVGMMLASYAMAVRWEGSLVGLLLMAYGAVVQFLPGIIASLYSRRLTGAGVLAGLVGGTVVTGALVWRPELGPAEVHAGLVGLTVNLGLLLGVSALGEAPVDDGFVAEAAGHSSRS